MNISDEAIEAAAKIIYRTSGRKRVKSYAEAREACRAEARTILEAAAPHLDAVGGRGMSHKEACCSITTGFDSDCCCILSDYEDQDAGAGE
jgi:hypothetical protein